MRRRPLHAIANHKWNAQNVRVFFLVLFWSITGWGAWGITAWRNTKTTNNATGAIILVVLGSTIAITLSLVTLWVHEEKRERESAEREKRIAAMEREVFGS